MAETREERKARDLRLADSMERHLTELEQDLEQYVGLQDWGTWRPELLGQMRHSIDNTRQLIRQLRGEEEPGNAV